MFIYRHINMYIYIYPYLVVVAKFVLFFVYGSAWVR